MADFLLILFSAALVNNIVVLGIIGADPALAFMRRMDVATGLCLAMLVLLPLVAVAGHLMDTWLLIPLQLEYLQLLVFVSNILLLTLLLKRFGQHINKKLDARINVFLPFAGINSAVLGTMLLNLEHTNTLLNSLGFGLGSALGFSLVLLLMTAALERLEAADVPVPFRGLPVTLITLALMSMAFMGFSGLIHH
jgi:electron transport complex protein RnfA